MESIQNLDISILNYIYENLHTEFLDVVMPAITMLANKGWIWITLGVLLLVFPKTRKIGAAVILSMALEAILTNIIIKPMVDRIRPFDINTAVELLISKPTDASFPSGHTGISFAAAVPIFMLNRKLGIPALILAALIAISRLYLYVHFPTDVLAGALVGIGCGYFITRWVKNSKRFKHFELDDKIESNNIIKSDNKIEPDDKKI